MIITVICYLTNPIVCLFANELGELPGFLRYWQTWDDSLDPRFFVVDKVWSIFKYDYDKHYEEYKGTTEELKEVGRERWFTRFKEGGETFTLKEKIQRYFCRVLWLTRNNAYGFSFWFLGQKVKASNMIWTPNKPGVRYGYDSSKSWWNRPWMYKNDSQISGKFYWEIFLGWKISDEDSGLHQAMIANRIWFSYND